VPDLLLVDRMGLVEADDRSDPGRLGHGRPHSGGGMAPARSVIRP
jgi:hypothetical protein